MAAVRKKPDRVKPVRMSRPTDPSEQHKAIASECSALGIPMPMKRGSDEYAARRAVRAAELHPETMTQQEADARGVVEPAALRALGLLAVVLMLIGCTPEQRSEARTAHDELCAKVLEHSQDYPEELKEARTVCLLRDAAKREGNGPGPDAGAP